MAMSLKAELEAWASALQAYDAEDFQQALELFEPISDTSRILTNIGLILATVGEHERAVDHFKRATELDQYLAIAYFQGGVSSFLLGNYEDAFEQFETALMWLRGNQAINYEQLGLNFRLYTAEILFNRGLCLLNMGRMDEGLQDLLAAQKDKSTPEHDVIDDAIKENGDGYTVFSIPVGIVFRPNPNKIKNLQAKDYLGKARLISNDGGKYEAFDGVDPDQLAFRREKTITRSTRAGRTSDPGARPDITPAAEGANLGRSSSDLGGTSAPRNPAGLSRAATTAVTPSRPAEPRRQPEALTRAMTTVRPAQPLARSTSVRPTAEPLARSATTVRPLAQPLARSGTTIRPARPQSPSQVPNSRSPEPIAGPGPIRGLSVRRPPGVLKPAAPPVDTDELYDSYSAQPEVDEWVEATVPGASPTRAPSRSASALGGRSQASYPSRSPSQYAPRRALSRKGTMASRRTRSYDEEEGYVSGSGEYDEVPFEVTKIRVRLHFNNDIRGMAILPDISCDEFQDKVCSKFGREYGDLSLKFADEDGARVTLIDDSDFELAIEIARTAALKGKESRLEIWCEKV